MRKPRVLVADDHTLVVAGFRKLLEDQCELIGTAEDGRAVVDMALHLQPDIVILDISMPLLNGIDAGEQIKKHLPDVKLLFVTMHSDTAYVQAAFKVGASGYLLKRSATDELEQAIRTVQSGNFYVTPLITKDIVNFMVHNKDAGSLTVDDLTIRQREILQLLAEGRPVKHIAGLLHISPRTVEFHKGRIMEQLNLHSTAELVRYALTNGLIRSI